MTRTKRLLLPALALAACAAVAIPALAATRSVSVVDSRFRPRALTVPRGTTVRWRFLGQQPHNVTVVHGPILFRSGTRTHGGTYSHRLTRPGLYRIVCTIHPGMTMTIRVR